jgi:general secretion pathway protein A
MYTEFYGLREKPFRLVPDPRYLFLGSCHREALAHLLYGIEQGEGFIQIVGQVGTGKTTLCRTLLERIGSEAEIAYIFNPSRTEVELLASINREFSLPTAARSRSELVEELNRFLLAKKSQGRPVLLVVDEAQNLEPEVLEQVRLLSNLETDREKLLQIVLIGQPELEENLARAELRQLRQRITVRWNLTPFDRREVGEYLKHRLKVGGRDGADLFDARAVRRLYRLSGGVPRVINAIADRALLAGYSKGARRIDARTVQRAAHELAGSELGDLRGPLGLRAGVAGALVCLGVVIGFLASAWWPLAWASGDDPAAALGPQLAAVEDVVSQTPPVDAAGQPSSGFLDGSAESTAAGALATILRLWGIPAPDRAGLDPNSFASAVGEVSVLRVFATRTSMPELERIGLPAVIELELMPGQRRYVALLGLAPGELARIGLREREVELDRSALQRLWTGRAFLVWDNFERLPAMGPGMKGTAVRWLQARLAELGYLEFGDASGEFDGFTEEAVRSFQSGHVLSDSGEVGPATLIALYQTLGYAGPRLVEREDQS